MELKEYFSDKTLNEDSAAALYVSMLNSVDTALQVIEAIIEESEEARNLKRLIGAQTKLKSAYSDLKMLPLEVLKNIAVKGFQSVGNNIKKTFGG
ncbi:MAG: hypothetical protein WC503_00975 [Candidatus Shapirobacteria bacterium]